MRSEPKFADETPRKPAKKFRGPASVFACCLRPSSASPERVLDASSTLQRAKSRYPDEFIVTGGAQKKRAGVQRRASGALRATAPSDSHYSEVDIVDGVGASRTHNHDRHKLHRLTLPSEAEIVFENALEYGSGGEPHYARIVKTPKVVPRHAQHNDGDGDGGGAARRARPVARHDDVKRDSTIVNSTDSMAMIATVHPFNERSDAAESRRHHRNAYDGAGDEEPDEEYGGKKYGGGGFKIEDVTDDPKYQNHREESWPEEEVGSLIEYCRLNRGGKIDAPAARRLAGPGATTVLNNNNKVNNNNNYGSLKTEKTVNNNLNNNNNNSHNYGSLRTTTKPTTIVNGNVQQQQGGCDNYHNNGYSKKWDPNNNNNNNKAGNLLLGRNNNGVSGYNGYSKANSWINNKYSANNNNDNNSSNNGYRRDERDNKTNNNRNNNTNFAAEWRFATVADHKKYGVYANNNNNSDNKNNNIPQNGYNNNNNGSFVNNKTNNNSKTVIGQTRTNNNSQNNNSNNKGPAGGAAAARGEMAHVIDVGVGQPCTQMARCSCIGFRPHQWRKVCVHCKCDRNDHEFGPGQVLNVYERLGVKPTPEMAALMAKSSAATGPLSSDRSDSIGSATHGYTWAPPGLPRNKVEEYMSQLPNHMIPRINSIGEKNRERQLMLQLPRQDLSVAYCKHLRTPAERHLYEEFVNARNEVALDIGYVCAALTKSTECRKCKGILMRNELAVVAPKLDEKSNAWHPACFSCATCEQLLVDLTYCVRDDNVYCERHYAELHKPRCSACDELIFAGEYTKAMNKDWHSDHFCCWQCDSSLTGQRYILRDDHPYCIKCYEEIFANTCDECSKHIGIDSKDLSYKDKHWHEDCFLCNMCKVSLVDKPFGSKNDRIFCSNCYDQAFATRCDGCNEIFKAGMKKMEYKGKQWHDKCFCCAMCKTPIGTRSFIPKNEDVFCTGCYEEKFATRCCKCKKVITTGGVTYKNEPWHRECFCCTNCSTSLAGQRFTSKDEKPYCADCYGELFAKRCSACVKPITGIGGAKFISFEDRHWHNECFVCAQCTTSLVGKGFITDGADILCPECAKARLMASNA